jgi:hypothetical protein
MPKDLVLLNRINLGVISVLGHLYATADWRAIDAEIRHDRPPATVLGHLEAKWRARREDLPGSVAARQAGGPLLGVAGGLASGLAS